MPFLSVALTLRRFRPGKLWRRRLPGIPGA